MSWYNKEIAERLRRDKYYLPELNNAADVTQIIARLSNELWHVHTEVDLKRKILAVTTRQQVAPYLVAHLINNLGYKVFTNKPQQLKSTKGG
ncbi:MAG: hypothetical protein ACYC2T_13715 [Bacillota bacterium]